jgi:chromate transport protein ChrA
MKSSGKRGPAQDSNVEISTVPVGQRELALYFLRLGTFGFGGPIALVGHMQKDLVEERHWFSLTFMILTLTKKVPEAAVILAAGAVGMFLHGDPR